MIIFSSSVVTCRVQKGGHNPPDESKVWKSEDYQLRFQREITDFFGYAFVSQEGTHSSFR